MTTKESKVHAANQVTHGTEQMTVVEWRRKIRARCMLDEEEIQFRARRRHPLDFCFDESSSVGRRSIVMLQKGMLSID